MHDASAAAFDDYTLVAAVAEERFTRQKGEGRAVPWLAVDEVLHIAGWSRRDVDAIATTRGFFSTRYYEFPRWREVYYALRGRDCDTRELAVLSNRFGIQDPHGLFRADRFRHRTEAVGAQQGRQIALDLAQQVGPLQGERRIELHQGGAGADLGICVAAARDAADADQRYAPAGRLVDAGELGRRGRE